jgi:uncharacterized ion transporter superfamily protein YfcC
VAAALTYIVPAGEFERRDDAKIGRKVVVAGSYHRVPQSPVNPFQALVAVPKGIVDAAGVLALVVMAGAAISVVDKTGALRGILVPQSDLLGLSRQVTVTATQFGPGVLNQFLPTDGALMAVLAIAGVRFEQWLKFCLPICGLLFVYGLAAVALAAALNLP